MYLTFLDHNALCSFIKDMIPPVKTKLVSSIITNLHTKWKNVSLIKGPIQLYGTRRKGLKRSRTDVWNKEVQIKKGLVPLCRTRRKGLKRSCPDVWNKEVGLKKGLFPLCGTRRKGFKKDLSSCVGQGGRA